MRALVLLLIAIWVSPSHAFQLRSAGAARRASNTQNRKPSPVLLVYGGLNNTIFLGCVTCGATDPRSIRNESGTYGSRYSTSSITNPYSEYGSPYGVESACNPFAMKAPVIVDRDGGYHGQLTINHRNPDRTSIATVQQFIAEVCAR